MVEYNYILAFLNQFAGSEYSPANEKLKYNGQIAYNAAKLLGFDIERRTGFKFVGSSKWQNSGHIAKYFWLQFKKEKYYNSPFSISVGTIKVGNKYRFKVYLEVSDNDSNIFNENRDALKNFNLSIIKIAQPTMKFYYEGMTQYKSYERIETDDNSIFRALSSNKYLKITTNIDVVVEEKDNNQIIVEKLCVAFNELIPHYDVIFEDVEQNSNWIIPCDNSRYDIISAFNKFTSLDWHITSQTQNIKKGDIVYIYVSKPYSRLMFKCVVEKIGSYSSEIDDREFIHGEKWDSSLGYFRIKLIKKLTSLHLSLCDLKNSGIQGNIQGARRIGKQAKDYIDNVSGFNEDIPLEEKTILSKMSEMEIEETLNAEDDSSCYVYKEKLVKTRKINKEIVDRIKGYYKGQCQLCGVVVGERFGKEITEAHHIEYFSKTQNNDSSNIIILCPNCHALIHKCNPVYNKIDYSYDFDNGEKLTIQNIGHLKNKGRR